MNLSHKDVTSDPYSAGRPREILPSLLANSPPGRSSTLPPLQRPLGPDRPRKQSVTKRGRESSHKKKTSRGSAADWLRRIQNDERLRPGGGHDRKALSAEPSADYGKRWEDLIDAADQAASAAGDIDEDRTPVSQLLACFRPSADGAAAGTALARFGSTRLATAAAAPAACPGHELPGVAAAASSNAPILQSGQRGSLPVGRERRELPHGTSWAKQLVADVSHGPQHSDLLRSLPRRVAAQGLIRLHRMHLRALPGLRRGPHGGTRGTKEVSPLCHHWRTVQALSAGCEMTAELLDCKLSTSAPTPQIFIPGRHRLATMRNGARRASIIHGFAFFSPSSSWESSELAMAVVRRRCPISDGGLTILFSFPQLDGRSGFCFAALVFFASRIGFPVGGRPMGQERFPTVITDVNVLDLSCVLYWCAETCLI